MSNEESKSKDNDLGMHQLRIKDDFQWKFRMDIFESTVFKCEFRWDPKNTSFAVFDSDLAYHGCGRKITKTNICYWSVKEDGFYFANVKNPPQEKLTKKKDWNSSFHKK
ncbi:hypothetical protein ACH5RR_039612 [Cinchona calisaya]|uniref:S-protein homolog n=1 Tax=Cinchona calisaya TaxID=153742 RepID=A0ABD2XYS4_9GENT